MNFTNGTASGNATVCEEGSGNASRGDFWLGIVASIIGSIMLNLGINIQKLAFVQLAKIPTAKRVKIYCYPLWIIGFTVYLVGNAGDAIGLTFTAQSIITPLGSVSLVSNLFFAWLLVGEKIDKATLVATALIILGVVSIVVSSNASCSSFTLEILMQRFRQVSFLVFSFFHIALLVYLLWYTMQKEKKMKGEDGIFNLSLRERFYMRLAYPVVGSLFAAWTVLLIKSSGELMKVSFRSGSTQFLRIESWLIVVGFIVSCPLQIVYIQKGLAYFEAMYIVPIFSSCWSIGSISMGALFWGEFAEFQVWQYFLFFLGVLLVMIGVVLLQKRSLEIKVHPDDVEISDDTESVHSIVSIEHSMNGATAATTLEGGDEVRLAIPTTAKSEGRDQTTVDDWTNSNSLGAKGSIGKITRGASFFTRAAGSLAVAKGMGTTSLAMIRTEEEGRVRQTLVRRLQTAPPGMSPGKQMQSYPSPATTSLTSPAKSMTTDHPVQLGARKAGIRSPSTSESAQNLRAKLAMRLG